MKKRNRFLALTLAAVMTSTCFTACGASSTSTSTSTGGTSTSTAASTSTDTTEAEKKEITFPLTDSPTISMFAPNFYAYTFDNCRAWDYLQEIRYVDWDVTGVDTGSMKENRDLLLATNQYPDVFWKGAFTQTEIDEQAALGTFIPLEDLIADYAPNLQAILDENPEIKDILTSDDGHIYSLPQIVAPDPQIINSWINATWMDNLGFEQPTSADELYDILKAFKDEDANGDGDPNNEVPFSTYSGTSFLNFAPFFDMKVDTTSATMIHDGVVEYAPASENYKEMLAFLAKLGKDGLLDTNSFSQAQDQLKSKAYGNDLYGMLLLTHPAYAVENSVVSQYDALNIFGEGAIYRGTGVAVGALTITDTCEDPEIVMAWADYFYSEEGGALAWVGIEGESFEYGADGKATTLMTIEELSSNKMNLSGGGAITSYRPEELRNSLLDGANAHFQAERDRYVAEFGDGVFPTFLFSQDQAQELGDINASLTTYVNEYLAKVAVGEYDLDETWDDYIKNLENMEMDTYVAIYQEVYDAM